MDEGSREPGEVGGDNRQARLEASCRADRGDEELLAENIALQNGTHVEEYQKRIAHLEYQLDLLKRRFGSEGLELAELPTQSAAASTLSLLVYNAYGRILRVDLTSDLEALGRIGDETLQTSEQPRLLVVPSNEEVTLLFTLGRVSTCAVEDISTVEIGGESMCANAALPDKPRAGNGWPVSCPFRSCRSQSFSCRSAAVAA